ncbi:amino acid adenylation domain-containing protein [Bradyrhizobium sp. CCGUVB1N3]|uniref:non-ribosomal peptide synthetase n=1 Tax=Bradyrhizobium sp. CCGUVB1N3 TaxID=2949629 RepID=UPI0020B1AAC8|nr:amino acid adenylation domain-containing protein [Bradyrhizobium sp. CCGUVB1N3]MCP3469091.1 amino acid adenylation domain-containing protein [Bradyrhizobium sp. CCGUVB1N3]
MTVLSAELSGVIDAGAHHFPLTLAQKRIWSLGQIGNHSVFPAQVLALRLQGAVGTEMLRSALRRLARRHPALRMRFRRLAGGHVEQTAATMDAFQVSTGDISQIAAEKRDAALLDAIADFLASPIDLEIDVSARARIIRLGDTDQVVVIALHPIVCDAASLRVLARDLPRALAGPRVDSVLDAGLHRAAVEHQWLHSSAHDDALSYWRSTFGEERICATLPVRPALGDGAAGLRKQHRFTLNPDLRMKVLDLAMASGLSERLVLLTAFNVLLALYGGQFRLRSGFVCDGRANSNATDVIARLEDLVPLRLDFSPAMTFVAAARHARDRLDEGLRHHLPLERLTQELWRDDQDMRGTYIASLFEHRDSLIDAPSTPPDITIGTVLAPATRADADLVLVTEVNVAGHLDVVIDASEALYDNALLARAANHFLRILESATLNGNVCLRDIALVSAEELDRLSAPYEDEATDDDRPVHEWIAAHAALTPDKTAIIYADERWTHADLDRRANQLAHRLIGAGTGPEVCVAVLVKRSPETIAAILAVLKAGGAYIPVEPDQPPARNHHIFRDAGVRVIITNSWLRERIPSDIDATILELDRLDLSEVPVTPPPVSVHHSQLAYVMYTSGSTGLPKGVAVEHGPLTHHCQSTARIYEMSEASRELPFLPFSSDGGHERWMVPLMMGGSIVLPDQALWTPEQTLSAMHRHGANNASIPTTYMQQLAEWADIAGDAPPLRLYSFGGEGLAQTTFDLLTRSLPAKWLINGYGPTETIMTPMVWKVRPGTRFHGTYAPIGRAVGRRRIYVLDADMNPCPIGVTGELYLGGEGVARGYVGRPGITADRFVPDPFAADGGRLYRSGDLTRWREDGTVEFVGRVDHQVKLRGYRIELGEIESALVEQPGVGECVALLRNDDGQPSLVAYVVPEVGATLDPDDLRRAVGGKLPDYMVPAAIVPLERLPINPNSKLDRAALPAPVKRLTDAVPPTTSLESELLEIWCEVLDLRAIGVTHDFFQIGGHSLAAIKILTRLKRQRPDLHTTIADLFNYPTVRSLAARIEGGGEEIGSQVIALRTSGSKPMLYCFPGLLVSTREYVKLVDFLGPEQPATGFICYSLSEDLKLNATVEEITGRYVEHIRRQSRGQPCLFLGWSWGGLLAYEAARMLGNDVDLRLIGMVDVCEIGSEFALGAIPQFAPGERDLLRSQVTDWLARTRMRSDWERLLASMDALTYEQFLRFIGNEKDELPTDGPDVSSREHTFWILIDNALIFRRYRMQRYDCPLHSWTAEDSLHRGLNLIDWRQYSRRANPAEIIAGTTHLHVIGSNAFHSRFAHRIEQAIADLGCPQSQHARR